MYNIAIVGASGLVGSSLISLLDHSNINANYLLFGNKSIGKSYTIAHQQYSVLDISTIYDYQLDYAMFMTSADISSQYIPILAYNNTVCIDNSSYFRMKDNIPLVVPNVNIDSIGNSNIIANPNCTTIQLCMVLKALSPLELKRIVCSTYQAVSGAGRQALDDWHNCANYGSLRSLNHPIYDNIIPHIDSFDSSGSTLEELKVINESRKILGIPHLPISCMAVRVPVSCGHAISVNIETATPYNLSTIQQLLQGHENIVLYDNPHKQMYPMPLLARSTHNVYVGRIHQDRCQDNTFNCFIVADNIVRGASYNALEILQHLIGVQ